MHEPFLKKILSCQGPSTSLLDRRWFLLNTVRNGNFGRGWLSNKIFIFRAAINWAKISFLPTQCIAFKVHWMIFTIKGFAIILYWPQTACFLEKSCYFSNICIFPIFFFIQQIIFNFALKIACFVQYLYSVLFWLYKT